MAGQTYSDVRPSPIAGTWYPGGADALARMVDGFLAAAQPDAPPGRIVGLLAPHAGFRCSGQVAAYAFSLLRGLTPEVVAVLCPFHHPPFEAPLFTTAHDAYQTPLGLVPVDREALEALEAHVSLRRVRYDEEHALEIELPFLQRVLPEGFTLLPVMILDQSPAVTRPLGEALAEVLRGRDALLVASSDLSHYYPQETANRLDRVVLDRVAAFDPQGVLDAEEQRKGFACGRGAIAAVMWAVRALGADTAQVVQYATSGDTCSDYMEVVGYGAGVFYQAA